MERRKNGKIETKPTDVDNNNAGCADHPYFDAVKRIGTVHTIEEFWSIYDYLVRPSNLPSTTDYHFFREGIQPTWEDPHNSRGGKFSLRLPDKGLASRYWEEVVLAMLGGQFMGVPDGEVCGAVVSVRGNQKCILSVWSKTADDPWVTNKVRESLRRVLQLPKNVPLPYQNHPQH